MRRDVLWCVLSKAVVCAGTAVLRDQEPFTVTPPLECRAFSQGLSTCVFKALFWQDTDDSVGSLCPSTVETSHVSFSVLPIAPDLLMFLGVAPLTPVSGVREPRCLGWEAKADN